MPPTKRSLRALLLLAPAALAVACAGAPFPAPIEGEPVCPDFAIGPTRAKMTGSLRYPVRLQILEGKNVLMKLILDGKRTADSPPAHTYIVDDNGDYTVEWAQCANERAPFPATDEHAKPSHSPKVKEGGAAYECGEAAVYKTDKLLTKKHDRSSHNLTFVAPPKPECWVSDAPVAEAADAGAPDAAAALPAEAAAASDAGAPASDAGAAASDAGAPAKGAGSAAVDTGSSKDEKVKDTKPPGK